jgi:tripartite-type tricarboxylate transporter receptor subunit TctC
MKTKKILAILLIVLAGFLAGTNLSASEADFFKGKTMTFIVCYPPGGGFDRIVRSLALPFQERLGARVIVKNLPGANGIRAANYIYKAKPDGLKIALLAGTSLILQVLDNTEGVAFDFTKYSFLGRVTAEQKTIYVNPKGKIKNLDDIVNSPVPLKYGDQGANQDTFVFMVALKSLMNFPVEMVVGYSGHYAVELAIMNGEIDIGLGAVGSRYPKIHAGDLKPIAILGEDNPEEPEYRNLPLLPGKYKLAPGGKEVMQAILNINGAHRIITAPPGMPEKRRQVLEDTLYSSLNDPKVKKQWKKEGRVAKFLTGKEYKKLAQAILDNPPKPLMDAWQKEKKKVKF